MDSKFGPDGALYVQVYEGFFTTGSDAGLYRFEYTGGADTPGPDPQWQSTATARADPVLDRRLRRRLLRVGLRRRPDLGRQPTRRTPTPTPAAYDAKLTVTYADGEKATKTIERHRSATTPPRRRRRSSSTTRRRRATYTAAVKVSLRATDGAGGTGVEWTEYRIDGGAWTRRDEHRQRLPVRDRVHDRRRGQPHGRVPLARPRRQRRDPGRVGHVRDRPPRRRRRRLLAAVGSVQRLGARSEVADRQPGPPATRRPWAAGV